MKSIEKFFRSSVSNVNKDKFHHELQRRENRRSSRSWKDALVGYVSNCSISQLQKGEYPISQFISILSNIPKTNRRQILHPMFFSLQNSLLYDIIMFIQQKIELIVDVIDDSIH